EDRKKFWESRDVYFTCLDREGNEEKSQYEASCAKSWIDYSNKRRILAEQQKDQLAQSKMQTQAAKQK
ncbi:hypothetical protein EV363DRAFT_1322796, partial [Boletus edulis]